MTRKNDLDDLLHRLDGVGNANARLAYYGQLRAAGDDHDKAIHGTYLHFKSWCDQYWPMRGIELPWS